MNHIRRETAMGQIVAEETENGLVKVRVTAREKAVAKTTEDLKPKIFDFVLSKEEAEDLAVSLIFASNARDILQRRVGDKTK